VSSDPAAVRSAESPFRDRTLLILFAATLVSVLGVSAITPALPGVVDALGISPQTVGLLITAYTVPGIVITPFQGVLADRIGRDTVLGMALCLHGTAGAACAFAGSFTTLLVLRVVQGVGSAPVIALVVSIIGMRYDGPARTRAVGYNSAVINVGTATYPAVGGLLATLGWQWPFVLPIIAVPIGGLVLARLDLDAEGGGRAGGAGAGLWATLRRPDVIGLLLASLSGFAVLFGSYLAYLPEWIDRQFTTDPFVIGLVVASASIANGTAASQVQRLAEAVPRRRLVVGSFGLGALALAMVPALPSLAALPVATTLFGASQGAGITSALDCLTEEAPEAHRATVLAVNGTAIRVGQTVGPALMGVVFAAASAAWVFYAGAALSLAAGLAVGALLIRRRPEEGGVRQRKSDE
jgi:MFS family permease